jgi:hypothetical protein
MLTYGLISFSLDTMLTYVFFFHFWDLCLCIVYFTFILCHANVWFNFQVLTPCLGMVYLAFNWHHADVWYALVQNISYLTPYLRMV